MRAIFLILCLAAVAKGLPTWHKIHRTFQDRKPNFTVVQRQTPDETRIVGGTEVQRGAFPFQVGVFIDTRWFCGGSLISENIVLTAAHCAQGFYSFEVYLGTHDIRAEVEDGRQIVSTNVAIVHHNFDPNMFTNDIAILKLPTSVLFSELIQPVRLPSRSQVALTLQGQVANVTGWGLTSETGSQSSVLLYTEVAILGNADCQAVYLPGLIHDHMLCVDTNGGQHGPCNGDSGGPLVILEADSVYTEVGVVSWGADAGCDGGYPEVFTRLTFFLDWIETNGGPQIRP